MLIANYSYINQICGHNHSGVTNPIWIISPHRMRGYYGKSQYEDIQEQIKRDSFPTGTNIHYSLIMGDKGGLLSATTTLNGGSGLTLGSLALGKDLSTTISGTGELADSSLSLITSMAAAITALGVISGASLVGSVSLACSITSSGDISGSLGLISSMVSALIGSGDITSNLRGTSSLEADIFVNQSEATTQELAAAVWNALTSDFNASGTMGEAMAAAGSAGDPWITNLPGAYGSGSAGHILGNLLSNIPDSVWDEIIANHTTAGTMGKKLKDSLKTGDFIALK